MTVWCFQCRNAYEDDVVECVECTAHTSNHEPLAPHEVGTEDDPQVAWELHAWSMVGRYELDKALWEADIVHGWMGAALIALEVDEAIIDPIVEKVETEFRPTLDPEQPLMEYALDDYPGEARDQITRRLDLAGVPYQIGADLVMIVHERDEQLVDDVFEKIVTGDSEIPTFGPGVEGVDPHLLIEKLFTSSDRLRRNPQDAKAKAMFLEVNDVIFDMALPWGYDAFFWKDVLDRVDHLYEIFESDDVDDFKETTSELTELLRTVL